MLTRDIDSNPLPPSQIPHKICVYVVCPQKSDNTSSSNSSFTVNIHVSAKLYRVSEQNDTEAKLAADNQTDTSTSL